MAWGLFVLYINHAYFDIFSHVGWSTAVLDTVMTPGNEGLTTSAGEVWVQDQVIHRVGPICKRTRKLMRPLKLLEHLIVTKA